eukprot:TRINITY_DN104677_c0_g1_i1.p1 TRINITY_DN104677_c0_g1~~TRINITY_DN104677_c0_g1_i1.p1  ORF type:complete len:201 (+),score=54.07 TRINITY_DN104677_c0_g1_i1:87-689(+)
MPPKGGHKARPVFTAESSFPKTWSELEAVKSRLSLHMDRVEYLAGARNRLTEASAAQARNLEFQLRTKTRSHQNLRLTQDLSKAVNGVSGALDEQKSMMSSSQTSWKRLDAINKYVVKAELERGGNEQADAAKKSGRSTQPKPAQYPVYQDLYNLRNREEGKPREPPMMAVYCSMPYLPPLSALQHGKKSNYDPNKSMTL